MDTPTKTLTWEDAIEQAMVPTDLDHYFHEKGGLFGQPQPRLNNAGTELTNFDIIRERAAKIYIEAHEGEEAEVEYADPDQKTVGGRWVYRTNGTLKQIYVRVPVFNPEQPNVGGSWDGFVVGTTVVPLTSVSRIKVKGDHSVVVL